MKKSTLLPVLLITFLLGSCSIYSLQPLYTENELVFDTQLLGIWKDQDSSTWIFEKAFRENSSVIQELGLSKKTYALTYTENQKSAKLYAHILKLGNYLFLDLYPSDNYDEEIGNELLAAHLLPVHTFAKIELSQDHLAIFPLNGDWLDSLFEQNKIRISHENVPYYGLTLTVLTASTSELQKFVTKYQNEKEAFEKPNRLTRKI